MSRSRQIGQMNGPGRSGLVLAASLAAVAIALALLVTARDFSQAAQGRASAVDPNGELVYVKQWGSFWYPSGVALDSSGNVYVSQGGNYRIQVFDPQGRLLRQWGERQLGYDSIAIDASDNVYLFEANNLRVQVHDSRGNLIRRWGSKGGGDGQFQSLDGGASGELALGPSGEVLVADSGNHRIQVFDQQGRFLRKWGAGGSANGQFRGGLTLAVDSLGNVYVGDSGTLRVQVFDRFGNFLRKWGSKGTGPGQFLQGIDVGDVDSSGNVFVTTLEADIHPEQGNPGGRVEVFGPNGNFIREWGGVLVPQDVEVDDAGNIYVVHQHVSRQHKVTKYRLLAGPDTTLRSPTVSAATRQAQRAGSIGVTVRFGSKEQVRAEATGTITVTGGARAQRVYKLRKQVRRNAPGSTQTLRLRPTNASQSRAIANALRRGQTARARISLRLTDQAGNTIRKTRVVRLVGRR